MGRKKKNEEVERQKMLTNSVEIAEHLGLAIQPYSVQQKASIIFEAADKVMTEICEKADLIKIDGFKQVKDLLADTVLFDKGMFFELVDIRKTAMFGELSDLEQKVPKIDESLDWNARQAAMKKALYKDIQIANGNLTKVLTAEIDVDVDTDANISDDEFMEWPEDVKELIDECAKTRNYINSILWPRLAKFADCFAIECQAETWEFYDLLKWYHYRKGGYPTENSAPKLWAIINKFQYAMRQLDKYGFDFGRQYCERAGLQIEFVHECEDSFHNWDL